MAAGLGFKTFSSGDVLTAADTNGYLMQGVNVFADAAARTAAITSPQEGQMSFLKDTNSTEYYSGSAWVAVAGSSGSNWSLLNAGGTALTGAATITVSGISGKDKIMILVAAASSASAQSIIGIRLNGDGGSNYGFQGINILGEANWAAGNVSVRTETGDSRFRLGNLSNNAASALSGYCLISGCASSGVKIMNLAAGANTGGGDGQQTAITGGVYNSSSTISSVSIISSTGNFDGGTIYVYTSA